VLFVLVGLCERSVAVGPGDDVPGPDGSPVGSSRTRSGILRSRGERGHAPSPNRISEPSNALLADRKYPVTEAPAAPPPWFFMVSDSVILCPAPTVAGAVSADTTRSGPIWIDRE